jgi:DNA-binding NarL/FixJ family response regulator
LVAGHQASDYETKTLAQARLAQLQADMPKEQFAAAQSRQLVNLDLITRKIQADLAAQPAQEPASTVTKPSPKSDELIEQLTPREVEVLQQIAAGLTNQDIANTLIISVGTVKFYTSQIYGKLSVGNRTQAVVRGRELGLLA